MTQNQQIGRWYRYNFDPDLDGNPEFTEIRHNCWCRGVWHHISHFASAGFYPPQTDSQRQSEFGTGSFDVKYPYYSPYIEDWYLPDATIGSFFWNGFPPRGYFWTTEDPMATKNFAEAMQDFGITERLLEWVDEGGNLYFFVPRVYTRQQHFDEMEPWEQEVYAEDLSLIDAGPRMTKEWVEICLEASGCDLTLGDLHDAEAGSPEPQVKWADYFDWQSVNYFHEIGGGQTLFKINGMNVGCASKHGQGRIGLFGFPFLVARDYQLLFEHFNNDLNQHYLYPKD